jgi:hypothetical protein
LRRSSNILRRSSNILRRSSNILRRSSNILRRSSNILRRSSNILRRSSKILPIGLFLLAGIWGVLIAGERGAALRELRWLFIGPLLFYALIWLHERTHPINRALLHCLLISGALVGMIGILQFLGLNIVPLIGQKVGFSDDSIFVEGVRRVSSVYGHPNNLGLFMGRLWPIAAALLVGIVLAAEGRRRTTDGKQQTADGKQQTADGGQRTAVGSRRSVVGGLLSALGSPLSALRSPYALLLLLTLGGLLVSFSRGAYLGAGAAALVIGTYLAPPNFWRSLRVRILFASGLGVALLGLVIIVALDIDRFNPFGGSSAIRVQTWISALAMLRDHPLGIGLDQFGRLYPQYIHPSLIGTNEINTAHPHNLLLDIALRLGPLGLLAFGWLIGQFFRILLPRARAAEPLAVGLCAAMIAALVHGLFDSFYFWSDLAFTFWLFIALAHMSTPAQDYGTLAPHRTDA